MEESAELKNVKAMLRSTLISVKEGVPAAVLSRDYQSIVGEPIPYKKFGFSTLAEFIKSIPDVVKIESRGQDFILHAVADESTSHIKALVSKQRSKKVKKPVRPRRGGGGRFMGKPIGPRKHLPNQGGFQQTPVHSRHGIPTFISPPQRKQFTPVMISFGNTAKGGRTVSVGESGARQLAMFNKAVMDANRDSQRSQQSPTSRQYELPPRFRNRIGQKSPPQQQQQQQQKPGHSTPVRRPPRQSLSAMLDGDVYINKLRQFMRERQLLMEFQTTQAAGGYASSVTVNKQTYGSGDLFRSAADAEAAAAQNACCDLGLDKPQQQEITMPPVNWNETDSYSPVLNWAEEMTREEQGGPSLPPGELMKVKSRVKEILHNKKNGLWGTRIPFEYKERYKEEPPGKLLELIKSWKDVARVEFVPNTDRDIVYPVEEDENKNLKIPQELLFKSDEGVVVYTSYVKSPEYFCVQREDSCIDEITEALQTHCKGCSAPSADQLEAGRFCAGLFSGDGNWTRAEILQNKKDGTVELLFVDYGNVEPTKVQNVRWLSPDLAKYPAQAIPCSLCGIEPLQGESGWSDAASNKFADLVGDQALVAVPINIYEDIVEVSLFLQSDPGKSISVRLAEARVVQSLDANDDDEDEDDLHPVDLVLPEDKEWDVHVTYVSSTTESVMVRLVGDEYSDKLDKFQSKLQEAFRNSSNEGPILPDRTYIAYDDDLYHRVRVMSQDDKKVECYFLDHGDTDELLHEQLHPIDPAVNKQLPYQAVEVSLYGLEDHCQNITALERICELALGRTLVAEVVERDDIPSVILYDTSSDSDININETILRTIEAEGGGIGSSSSTPRVLSPAQSASDMNSNVNSEGKRRVDDKSSKNTDVQARTGEISTCAINSQTPVSETDQNSNSLKTSPQVNGSLTADSIYNSDQTTGNTETSAVNNVSPPRQMIADQMADVSLNEKLTTPASQQSVTRPILGRSPDAKTAKDSNVTEQLSEDYPKPFRVPPVGEFLDLHINYVYDPSRFVCMPFHEMGKLNQLLLDMIEYYKESKHQMSMSDIEVGKLYAGRKEGVVFRVKASNLVGSDLVSVYLVDIGEFTVMKVSELQPLADQFRQLPMMAVNATLGSIRPVSGTWYEAAKYLFIELANDKDLVGLVQGHDPKTGTVNFRLIDTSSEEVDLCIDEVLVKKGFAQHVDV